MPRIGNKNPLPRLILASGSARRAALMAEHGYDVQIMPPPVEEPAHLYEELIPPHRAQALSHFKARSVAEQVKQGWILAGDTIVSDGSVVFGKPADREHARSILQLLSGTTHHVITGVTLLDAHSRIHWTTHDTTAVSMKTLSDDEIEAYLDTCEWQGKAGAYGIQDRGDAFVKKIEGSFSNVVGFPMELIDRMLSDWGWPPSKLRG